MSEKKETVIALVCERSVDFDKKLDDKGWMNDCPNVNVIRVPCSGQIQPSMIEGALKQGASGVITTGCRIGDCHYREGNKFLQERLLGQRQPKLRASVDRNCIQGYWLSALEYNQFRTQADKFQEFLKTYEPEKKN